MQNSSKSAVENVLELLDLEKIEENIFRGHNPVGETGRIFGGQVLGQALVAAGRTIDARTCHSFHAYFLRAGDPTIPILYEVDRSRDGSSFSSRRVVAIQHGVQIFNMAASFQVSEQGLEHQFEMPNVPGPEELADEREARKRFIEQLPEAIREKARAMNNRPHAIEMRPVVLDDWSNRKPREPFDNVWMRATGPLPDNMLVQQAILAYASDRTLLSTSFLPHGRNYGPTMQVASLDHAMWFHCAFKADEWLLYAKDAPSSSGGRGFNRGLLFTREGKLVASVAQEGLMRVREPK